jgi:hypothetical protein
MDRIQDSLDTLYEKLFSELVDSSGRLSGVKIKLFSLTHRVNRIQESLKLGHMLVTGVLLSISYWASISFPLQNFVSFSSTVLSSSVVLLSILFSLTVLGVNLVSQNFEIRLNEQIRRNTWLLASILFFFSTVVINSVIILSSSATTLLATSSIFSSLMFVACLFRWMIEAVTLTQPANIVEHRIKEFTGDYSVLSYSNSLENEDEKEGHPMFPIYSMTLSSLSQKEVQTTRKGISGIADWTENTITETSDFFRDTRLFSEIVKQSLEFLMDIALQSGKEQGEIAEQVLEEFTDIVDELPSQLKKDHLGDISLKAKQVIWKGVRRDVQPRVINKGMKTLLILVQRTTSTEEPGEDIKNFDREIRKLEVVEEIGYYIDSEDFAHYEIAFRETFNTLPCILHQVAKPVVYDFNSSDVEFEYPSVSRKPSDGEQIMDAFFGVATTSIEAVFYQWREDDSENNRVISSTKSFVGDSITEIGRKASMFDENTKKYLWRFCLEASFKASRLDEDEKYWERRLAEAVVVDKEGFREIAESMIKERDGIQLFGSYSEKDSGEVFITSINPFSSKSRSDKPFDKWLRNNYTDIENRAKELESRGLEYEELDINDKPASNIH